MSTWRPINTAPKDGTAILLAVGKIVGSGRFVHCAPWGGHWKDRYYFDGGTHPSGATHWMPLPEPPMTDGVQK